MLISLLFNLIILVIGAIFSWLPVVDKLPRIAGFDIDTALSAGMGSTQTFFTTFWFLGIIFQGFLVLMGYYLVKMVVRFFIGHRTPGG